MESYDDFTASGYLKRRKDARNVEDEKRRQDLKEIDDIVGRTRQVEDEALGAVRRTLRTADETESIGKNTVAELDQQKEALMNIEKKVILVDEKAEKNYIESKKVKKYDKFLGISFGKLFRKKKHKIDKEYKKRRESVEDKKQKHATTHVEAPQEQPGPIKEAEAAAKQKSKKDEIDEGLDAISKKVSNLKNLGLQMRHKIGENEILIESIEVTGKHADETLDRASRKLKLFT